MILWRLRGGTSAEIVCPIERAGEGYGLVVTRAGAIEHDEQIGNVTAARARAVTLRDQLLALGLMAA